MIDLHYWTTPNGHKITIFLEETGTPYKIIPVNIGKGEQFKARFLAVSPNNRIPAIVDQAPADGGKPIAVFESGAILLYLAEKTGKYPFPRYPRADRCDPVAVLADGQSRPHGRAEQPLQQLRRGEDSVRHGPLPQRGEPAVRRAQQATCGSLLRRRRIFDRRHGDLSRGSCRTSARARSSEDFPHLKRWFEAIRARPAVERAYAKAKEINPNLGGIRTAEERAILFGQTAASVDRAAAAAGADRLSVDHVWRQTRSGRPGA